MNDNTFGYKRIPDCVCGFPVEVKVHKVLSTKFYIHCGSCGRGTKKYRDINLVIQDWRKLMKSFKVETA